MRTTLKHTFLFLLLPLLYYSTVYSQDNESTQKRHDLEEDSVQISDSIMLHQADSLEKEAFKLEQLLENSDTLTEGNNNDSSTFARRLSSIREKIGTLGKNISSKVTDLTSSMEKKPADATTPSSTPVAPVHSVHVIVEEPEEKKGSGSFGLSFEYTMFDVDPLKYLARHDRSLAGIPLSFDDNQMLTLGLMGYYSRDNSLRLGNGLYIGYKSFQSETYSRPLDGNDSAELADSMVTLRVIPIYFGFLCEKAFRFQPVDYFAGLMIGGHMTVVVKEEQSARMASSFINSDDSDDDDDPRYSVALSPAVFWDVHGGLAFALSERFHLGIEGVARFAYSYEGFGAGFGDYLTISPGVRIRLTFGNAG